MKTLLFVVLLVSVLALPTFAVDYVLSDLGLGSGYSINDSGQITGWRPNPNGGPDNAFFWSKETGFKDIGLYAGQAINNSGQTVGNGWVWSQEGGLLSISLPSSIDNVASNAINNSGQIAGWVHGNNGIYDAVMWNSPTEFVNIDIHGWAYDINNSGRVVGEYKPSNGEDHAFFWDVSTGLADLGDFGTIFARADGINDLNQIVGQYNPDDCRHAFLWSATKGLLDLGTLLGWQSNSQAVKINNNGLVVGWSMAVPSSPTPHAFVWNQSDGMIDLGSLGGVKSYAGDINSSNQVVGTFYDSQGYEHIALWEPVPEPSSLLALCGGIVGLLTFRRRRRQRTYFELNQIHP